MSFISSITSDIKSLATDPGKIAKDICDTVLPQNMKAVGDVVGGAVDIETGHPVQALSHMTDALKDLPQMAQGLPGTTVSKAAATPAGTAAAEPTPPPARASSLQQVISELTALAGGGATPTAKPACTTAATAAPATTAAPTATTTAASTTACAGAAPATTVAPAAAPPVTSAPTPAIAAGSSQVTISVSSNGRTVNMSERYTTTAGGEPYRAPTTRPRGWHSTPAGPTVSTTTTTANPAASPQNGTSTAAAGTAAATGATVSSTPTAAASTAAASGTAATGSAAAPSSLSSLMSMSNDQFMQAVTSGNIPADVANNPSAMAEIQARMNQITQMNQLVTSMMAAMHQMQMAIIQNIRV